MIQLEAAQLLTIASGFDRFITADDITSTSWALALDDVPVDVARDAIVAHYRSANGRRSVTVADILDFASAKHRSAQHQVEADVRSAKARGLIARDWPARQPLHPLAAKALAEARESARVTASGYQEVEA